MQRKILLLVTRGTVGGAQTSVLNLARELTQRGEQVVVGYGDGIFLQKECARINIETHQFHHLRPSYNPFKALRALHEIRRYLAQEHFSVVHLNSTNALVGALSARLVRSRPKAVFTFHGLSFLDPGAAVSRIKRLIFKTFVKLLIPFVDVCVFVSEENKRTARAHGIRCSKSMVIYNGLNQDTLSFLSRDEARRELEKLTGVSLGGRFVIGSIGRLASQKNYEFLIEQMYDIRTKHPHAIAVIVGDGPERAHLESLIQQHGLAEHVVLAGETPNAAQYMRAFDIFVLPSRYEGFSISLTEALFAGVPVLASDVGGAREQLTHAPYQVYPYNDASVFQTRMSELIEQDHIRTELTETNKKQSSNFTISKTTDAYLHVYNTFYRK